MNPHCNRMDIDPDYQAMSLSELRITVDQELLSDTIKDILQVPPCLRSKAIDDFCLIDPVLGAKLRLEFSLTL